MPISQMYLIRVLVITPSRGMLRTTGTCAAFALFTQTEQTDMVFVHVVLHEYRHGTLHRVYCTLYRPCVQTAIQLQ